MPEDTLRWPGGWARLGPWHGRSDIAHLTIGARRPPSPDLVERWLQVLARHGYESVVTNALRPLDTLPFMDAGFSVQERLHLLTHDLADIPLVSVGSRRARIADEPAVLELDRRAFRPFWQLDERLLRHAVDATAATRFRVVGEPGEVTGYAITGRADRRGYLQRIGVDPAAQGHGVGRSLVADALRWTRRHRANDAVVNTQTDNDPALALYRSCGFRDLPTGLCVMGRAL
jgi:GNAT superfamily N-acetyltransferase